MRSLLLLGVLGMLLIALPERAHAWSPEPPQNPLGVCEGEGGDYVGFTRRIVLCIQNTVLAAVYQILGGLFGHFYSVLGAAITLGVAIWGAQLAAGQRDWHARQGPIMAIKCVALITLYGGAGHDFLFFFRTALDFLDETLSAVTSYVNLSQTLDCSVKPPSNPAWAVWDRVDCALNTIIGGIFSDSDVSVGLGGFFLAALLAPAPGAFVALFIFLIILQLIFAIIRAMYIYVLAYVSFALMALVSPIFLPMMLFRPTQGYFEKWLRLTLGFVLQPIFIFIYLAMLLAAYDKVVYTGSNSLFNIITKNEYTSCGPPGCGDDNGCKLDSCKPIGQWLKDNGVYTVAKRGNVSVATNVEYAYGQSCSTGGLVCEQNDLVQDKAGMAGDLAEVKTDDSIWAGTATNLQEKVYEQLGVNEYFFHVKASMEIVNWNTMSEKAGFGPDIKQFYTKLFTALFMAVVTTHVFLLLLDMLPFIGSGITNMGGFLASGSPGFGFGSLAPPGAGMLNNLRKKVTG